MKWVGFAVLALLGLMAYVRLSPNDPTRWHQPIQGDRDKQFNAGAIRVVAARAEDFTRLHEIALSWPRTKVLSGSQSEGRITYISRTAFWGFPDFTTVELRDGQIALYGRLRFGRRDFGVNAVRIDQWLDALAQE
ncbi:hypothetical protein TG4357_00281 [Thalassovita gelatinovora]|uniref:DUF1499 domain-containing protein n=1 Tax=Thalassovita gelatinovora TaxID=53501 RepID=A0A0P1F4N3_THAGE|nr:DUF1499 domain-containing protein [Thalassovita gelatinovora]QIZ79410.1 DUF1499 domain-containing protein [Thalassovita gelatinovora]CUH62751.1 hypothetical protein TG4357_00281 [Thalassovita gelatinovora]SEQ09535.1 Protein of unknown function [Thalassovita gelatinovora]